MVPVDDKSSNFGLAVSKNVFKNTYVKLIRNGVLMAQGFSIAPLVIGVFGLPLAGVWFLITQFAAFIVLLEFGIPSGLTRLYSRDKALKNTNEANDVSLVSVMLLGFVTTVLAFNANQLIDLFFFAFDEFERSQSVEFAVSFGIFATLLSIPFRCGVGLLEANQLFYVHLWVEIILVIFRLVVLYSLYFFGLFDIEVLSVVYFSASFFIPFIQFLLCIEKQLFVFSLRACLSIPMYFKRLMSIGVAITLITLSSTSLRQGSSMILGALEGASAVALFSIVMLVVTSIMQFLTVAVSFIGPQASQIDAFGESKRLYTLFLDYSRYSLVVAVNAFFAFFLFGEAVLFIWLNLDSASVLLIKKAVLILLFTLCLSVPALYARTVLSFINRHKISSASEVLVVLVGLLFGVAAVVKFELGVIGMAYGIALVFLLRAFGPIFFIFTNQFNVSKLRYFVDVYWFNLVPLVSVISSVLFVKRYIMLNPSGYMYFFCVTFFWVCLMLLQWFLVVRPEHRTVIKRFFTLIKES